MILADTSVWIDYFNGVDTTQTDILDRALASELVIIGDLVLAELLQGFKTSRMAEEVRVKLLSCINRDLVGYECAVKASQNFRTLREKGVTVRKTIDMLIGTYCIENGVYLIHNDRDFDPMEKFLGLKVLK